MFDRSIVKDIFQKSLCSSDASGLTQKSMSLHCKFPSTLQFSYFLKKKNKKIKTCIIWRHLLIYEVDHIAILQFVVPALFLQWEGLFDDAEEVQCNAKRVAIGIIGKWSQSNPCGRVIVFHLSAKQPCPGKAIVIPCLTEKGSLVAQSKKAH